MSTRKRKALTLEERVKVVQRNEKGETAKAISISLNVGKTQIQSIIKEKESILRRWENGDSSASKIKVRKCLYDDLNEKVWDWFLNARERNVPISGKLIQEKALVLSIELGHDDFTASNGWLEKFLNRHNIKSFSLSGDRAEVSNDTVEDWKKRLPAICEGYEAKDIFNADETGLFYRAMPAKSMTVKGTDCGGIKGSKDRITVLLAASCTGEKLTPLVVGKREKPRCFVGCDINSLGLDYFFNKKAWMTAQIFTKWANKLNNKMLLQGRNILMFIDNCPAHSKLTLSNIKFVMLPPNTTSKLQPCDAGIIQALKLYYRKQLLRHVLFEMEQDRTASGPDLAKKVSLLDALLWLRKAWKLVQPSTISKCFISCGFQSEQVEELASVGNEETPETPEVEALLDGLQMEQYSAFDDSVQTCLADDEEKPTCSTADQASNFEDQDAEEEEMEEPTIDFKTAARYAMQLRTFAVRNNLPALTETMTAAKDEIQRVCLIRQASVKQATLHNFFKTHS